MVSKQQLHYCHRAHAQMNSHTAEMKSSSNVQTRDDVLHAGTASEDEPEKGIEAHHKHC